MLFYKRYYSQVYFSVKDARILICCPENTAADLIMKKLISKSLSGPVQQRDIYRLYAVYRPLLSVPTEIMVSTLRRVQSTTVCPKINNGKHSTPCTGHYCLSQHK